MPAYLDKYFTYERKMNRNAYLITEFHDGLQLIPVLWYNADIKAFDLLNLKANSA